VAAAVGHRSEIAPSFFIHPFDFCGLPTVDLERVAFHSLFFFIYCVVCSVFFPSMACLLASATTMARLVEMGVSHGATVPRAQLSAQRASIRLLFRSLCVASTRTHTTLLLMRFLGFPFPYTPLQPPGLASLREPRSDVLFPSRRFEDNAMCLMHDS
jgi:hypothetical protein